MNIQALAQKLIDSGYSQSRLAEEIRSRGVQCTQPVIHRILKGSDPSWRIGHMIEQIHKEKALEEDAA